MPTGYTHKLMESGESFESFVMRCARAFGACVEMRDDPMDAPIPEKFEPSDYNSKALIQAEAELKNLLSLDKAGREKFGAEKKAAAIAGAEGALQKDRDENSRLEKMESVVRDWVPPTDDHQGLKTFMLEQIQISKNGDYALDHVCEAKSKSTLAYFQEALASAQWSVDYHRKEMAKEIERASNRTIWIKRLRESVKATPATKLA